MATRYEVESILKLHEEGWVSLIQDPQPDPMEMPIGGPVFMLSPTGDIAKVNPDGKIWVMKREEWEEKAHLKEATQPPSSSLKI